MNSVLKNTQGFALVLAKGPIHSHNVSCMKSNSWQPLQVGDEVAIVAPGMAYDPQHFRRALKILKAWGLKPLVPSDILGADLICANSTKNRQRTLKQALESNCKVIWCARGGYGSLQLLKDLQKLKRPKMTKLLIGFSDITTLHGFLNQQWHWPSLHGPHIDRLAFLNITRLKEIQSILFGQKTNLKYNNLIPLNSAAEKNISIRSQVVGGNLVTLQSTLGTQWQISTQNKIVFLEDIGERAYRVDRALLHMEMLGLWKNPAAIIFGPFVHSNEPGGKRSKVPQLLKQFAQNHKIPMYQGIRSGHVDQSLSLPFNTPAEINKERNKHVLEVSSGVQW